MQNKGMAREQAAGSLLVDNSGVMVADATSAPPFESQLWEGQHGVLDAGSTHVAS